MPVVYCPIKAHRVQFSGIKPAKCPTCGADMSPPPVVASQAAATVVLAPISRKQTWADIGFVSNQSLEEQDRLERGGSSARSGRRQETAEIEDGDIAFDRGTLRVSKDDTKLMTVQELRESGQAVERTGDSGTRVEGASNRVLSTADLVKEMIAADGGGGRQVATASAAKPMAARPKRARAGGKRAAAKGVQS